MYTHDFPDCSKIVLSNGYCYKIYEKAGDDTWNLSAYLNILKPQERYPVDPSVLGALEALRLMLP